VTGRSDGDAPDYGIEPAGPGPIVPEARWHMAGAVLAAMLLTLLLPSDLRLGPLWLLPILEGALLIALIIGDPGRISKRSSLLRGFSIALVTVLIAQSLWSTARLIEELIVGGPDTNEPGPLLAAAAIVWVSNNIAFALLYWELDSGGAAERAHALRDHPDLAFPQQMNPDIAPPNWRPRFIDYLYLGFTNATAFSPTDAMPLVPWAKIAMTVQAAISLAVLGLVVARAANALT
jgi:hypothetical protein